MFSQHRLLWPGHTGVSGRDGIEKDADSRAKGIRGKAGFDEIGSCKKFGSIR